MEITIKLDSSSPVIAMLEKLINKATADTIASIESDPVVPVSDGDDASEVIPPNPFIIPLVVPVTPPAPIIPGVDIDKDGLPWDVRIHASSKAILASGKWRQKRNVDPALVTQVTAELRGAMAVPTPTAQEIPNGAAPGVGSVNAPPPPAPVTPPGPIAPVDLASRAAPIVPGATNITFPNFMQRTTGAGIDQATIQATCAQHGLESIALLASRSDILQVVARDLGL